MTASVHTLLLYAAGFPSKPRTIFDTIREELPCLVDIVPVSWRQAIFTHRFFKGYENLSYVLDWKQAFSDTSELKIDFCNTNNILNFQRTMKKIRLYELIVVLHSAAGDNMDRLLDAVPAFTNRKCKLLIFYGNEYALMEKKIRFAKQVDADFVASQLPLDSARWVYGDCVRSRVVAAPAALNPNVYKSLGKSRSIDIGFRGTLYPTFIGDVERTEILQRFKYFPVSDDLRIDIEFRSIDQNRWALYLNSCKGIPGAESGTFYLEKDDHTQKEVMAYLKQHPKAAFSEIYDAFFKQFRSPVSGKSISSRHFEAIGTKTCQLLLEGNYNGLLIPGLHYISVKKDFSNLKDAIRELQDAGRCAQIVNEAHSHAMSAHTYRHRVDEILKTVLA